MNKKVVWAGIIFFITAIIGGSILYAQVTENLSVTAQVNPATLTISGYTVPTSLVTITNYGTALGTTVSDSNGFFTKTFSPLTPGTYEIAMYATDQDGQDTPERTFSFTIVQNQLVEYDNILLPPTIYVTNDTVGQNGNLVITSYGKPQQLLTLEVQGSTNQTYTTTTDSSGKGVFTISLATYEMGSYTAFTYFESSYPSHSLNITVTAPPSSTPTPLPSSTPIPTITPIPPTAGPGPSATPGIATSVTMTAIPTPFIRRIPCVFPYQALCDIDTSNNSNNLLDENGEWEIIFTGLITEVLDVNKDGVVDAMDLNIVLKYISFPASTYATFHANAVENDGLCRMTVSTPANYFLFIMIIFILVIILLLSRLLIQSFGVVGRGFSVLQLLSLILIITAAYFVFQAQQSQIGLIRTNDLQSERQKSLTVNSPRSYDVLISSNGKPITTVDLFLSFNPQAMKLTLIDLSESFASVITKVEYSNKCGKIHIIGGIPKPATVLHQELFTQTTFKVKNPQLDTSLVVFPGTRAFQGDTSKASGAFNPAVKIIPVNK